MVRVAVASAASVVMPSKQLPGPLAIHRHEVIDAPDTVKAQLFGETDASNDLVEFQALLCDIEAEPHQDKIYLGDRFLSDVQSSVLVAPMMPS